MSRPRRHPRLPESQQPLIETKLTAVAFGGEALGRHPDGRVLFAANGLPGESVSLRVIEDRKDYVRGSVEDVQFASPERVEPPCTHFREGCGGCSWQHASAAAQLRFKEEVVRDQLRRVGHFDDVENLVAPAIGMLHPWQYRNQARFSVGRRFGELCFTYRWSHRLLPVEHCWIVHPAVDEVLQGLQRRLAGSDRRIHQIGIRIGANTGERLVTPFLPEVPDIATGQPFLEEELLGQRFRLHASSFFQVNTRRERRPLPAAIRRPLRDMPDDGLSMAELLALLVLDRLEPAPDQLVVDAYGGVGTFALLMAPLVGEVVGIEESRTAVADAEYNARDVANARFIEGRTEDILPVIALERRPDAVVLDPARVGAHPAVLASLLAPELRPAKIVYVSCDPATLARDLRIMVDGGYHLAEVQPLDMFPQTYHIECVATLEL